MKLINQFAVQNYVVMQTSMAIMCLCLLGTHIGYSQKFPTQPDSRPKEQTKPVQSIPRIVTYPDIPCLFEKPKELRKIKTGNPQEIAVKIINLLKSSGFETKNSQTQEGLLFTKNIEKVIQEKIFIWFERDFLDPKNYLKLHYSNCIYMDAGNGFKCYHNSTYNYTGKTDFQKIENKIKTF